MLKISGLLYNTKKYVPDDWRRQELSMDDGAHKHEEHKIWLAEQFKRAELGGYWAETQIFGGVVLFDRGNTGEEVARDAYDAMTNWPDCTKTCKRADEAAKQAAGEPYDEAFMAESEGRRLHVTPTSLLWDRLKGEIAE
ncbi:hypothetical protein LA080_009211 [Diaporthe eres]|nr:hypothetical protein LA080_009211 [Diaporthe eres]